MFARLYEVLRMSRDLGRAYWLSREPHVQQRLPETFPKGQWVVLACRRPASEGVVYATPARRAVEPGERFWIFVEEGDYYLYTLPGDDPSAALRAFYASPGSAQLLSEETARAERGFREDKK